MPSLSFSDGSNYTLIAPHCWSHQFRHFGHIICFDKHKARMLRATSTTNQVFDSQFLAPCGPICDGVNAFFPFLQVRATVFRGVMVLNMESHNFLLSRKDIGSRRLYDRSA